MLTGINVCRIPKKDTGLIVTQAPYGGTKLAAITQILPGYLNTCHAYTP